jgi:phosphoserine phosphatase RsbU/P
MGNMNNTNVTRLQDENDNLKKTILELSILNEIAIAVSSAKTVSEIEHMIIKKCIKHLGAEEGIIMLLDEANESSKFTTMLRTHNSAINSLPYKLDDQLMGWMFKNKIALVTNNFAEDERFDKGGVQNTQITSLMCVPMFVKSRMIGMITLINKIDGAFTVEDKRLLSICAAQSAQVLENARLYEQEAVLVRLQDEMNLAAQIQANLLPRSEIKIPGLLIVGKTIPAKVVGGDFYDVVTLSDGSAVIWLGDISGKGMPAALLMANIQGVLRSQTMMNNNIEDSIHFVNNSMCENSESEKFATVFYAKFNSATNQFSFISAGHNNLIHITKESEVKNYNSDDIPLGIYMDQKFNEKSIDVSPDDLLIVFSDGITEAKNIRDELYGEQNLVEIIKNNKDLPPQKIIAKVFTSVSGFTKNEPQYDDQTILIIKLEPR